MAKHVRHEHLAGTPTTPLQVYAIRLSDTDCPALAWLRSLNRKEQAAIGSRLGTFAEVGWLRSPDAFNNLAEADPNNLDKPRVDEIKHVGQNLRLYVVDFTPGRNHAYVTHGTKKPKPRQVAKEVKKAREIFKKGMIS